jgi:hypothetical protein
MRPGTKRFIRICGIFSLAVLFPGINKQNHALEKYTKYEEVKD